MPLNSKQKSNIIFWGLFLGFIAFLYLTPWGEHTRTWLNGVLLTSPNIEEAKVMNKDDRFIQTDWNLQSTLNDEVWLSQFEKPIFINIWATWCPPCRAELPSIIELSKQYHDKVDFLLVSPDEDLQTLKTFAKKNNYTIAFFNELTTAPSNLQTGSYPTTFILNKNKEINYKMVGSHDWNSEKVHQLLEKLITE